MWWQHTHKHNTTQHTYTVLLCSSHTAAEEALYCLYCLSLVLRSWKGSTECCSSCADDTVLHTTCTDAFALTVLHLHARSVWWSTDWTIAGAVFEVCVTAIHFQGSLKSLRNGMPFHGDVGESGSLGKMVRFKCPVPWQTALYYILRGHLESLWKLIKATVSSDFSKSIKSGVTFEK